MFRAGGETEPAQHSTKWNPHHNQIQGKSGLMERESQSRKNSLNWLSSVLKVSYRWGWGDTRILPTLEIWMSYLLNSYNREHNYRINLIGHFLSLNMSRLSYITLAGAPTCTCTLCTHLHPPLRKKSCMKPWYCTHLYWLLIILFVFNVSVTHGVHTALRVHAWSLITLIVVYC